MKKLLLLLLPFCASSQMIGNPKLTAYHEYKDTVITKYSDLCISYDTYPPHIVCDSIGQVPARISRLYVLLMVDGEIKKHYLPEHEIITPLK